MFKASEITASDLSHDFLFSRRRWVQAKMCATPPSPEYPIHAGQVEVVIRLSERDAELCLELWQLIGRYLS